MRKIRKTIIFLLTVMMLFAATACSQPEPEVNDEKEAVDIAVTPEVSPESGEPIKSEEEIAQELIESREKELQEIRVINVLENVPVEKAEDSVIKKNYETVPLKNMEEAMAWQTALGGEAHETYIFIGKLGEDADVNVIASELMNSAANLPGTRMDGTIQCASSNGYIIMASAPNASEILNKFTAAMTIPTLEGVEDVFSALSEDIDADTEMETTNIQNPDSEEDVIVESITLAEG